MNRNVSVCRFIFLLANILEGSRTLGDVFAGRINVHFKDEGVPKVQVAFQSGEVKVLEESQLMSEKAPRCDVQITSRVFFVSGAWDLYLAIYILLFIDAPLYFWM